MDKHEKPEEKPKKPLDTFSEKRARGRPARMRPSEIAGRAGGYRIIFDQVWDRLWPLLSKAQNEAEVTEAFQQGACPYDRSFVPSMAGLVLKIINEKKFPARRSAQIGFLADSLAALGVVTPRRSRDVCAEEREKTKRAHHIIRYEFYIECSCDYRGYSENHACPKCGAEILFPVHFGSVFV
jgi:hypothetical protein